MYFKVTSPVKSKKNNPNVYYFRCSNRKILGYIIEHIMSNCLIGGKNVEYSKFAFNLLTKK